MTARFEVVRSDAPQPWHARFRAANGRIVWTTETYGRKGRAERAIEALIDHFPGVWLAPYGEGVVAQLSSWEKTDYTVFEVRYIDERVTPHA